MAYFRKIEILIKLRVIIKKFREIEVSPITRNPAKLHQMKIISRK